MWSQDPPFQAWPAGHVHRRAALPPYVTSPVRGVAASTLVALARQQSANRRAPTWEFRRLLAAEPEDVQAQVRAPAPSLVTCGPAEHRLALRDGVLLALDHPDVDVEDELVAAALGGPPLQPCLHLLEAWRSRTLVVLRRAGLWNLLVLDTAGRWAEVGDDAERRDAWTARALGPREVEQARRQGMGERDLALWSVLAVGVDELVAWWRSGWTVREAQALRLEGLTAGSASQWREAGLDAGRVKEGRRAGLDADTAGRWYAAGWALAVAGEAAADGRTLEEAEALAELVGRRAAAPALLRAGVTPESARWWKQRGHAVRELAIMAEDGMDLRDLTLFSS